MWNRTILVTGATGFIGSHLCERLIRDGAQVRCLVRPAAPRGHRFMPPPGADSVPGDLVSGAGLEPAVKNVEIIFHLAGVTKALKPTAYHLGNVQATGNLLEACRRAGVRPRFVHVSSLAAAGPSADGAPVRESDPPHPVSNYGESKLQAETAVRESALAEQAVIVRPPVVYGPRDRDVLQAFRAVSRGIMLQIGSGTSYFSYIHVQDLVEGLLAVACCDSGGGSIFNLANLRPISWREFAGISAELMGRKVWVAPVPVSAAMLFGYAADLMARIRREPQILSTDKIREAAHHNWTCDTSLAGQKLGYKPQLSFREGVNSTLVWYREEGWLNF